MTLRLVECYTLTTQKISVALKEKDDAFRLQTDIDTLERWTSMWLMKFHPNKCHVLTLGKFTDIRYAHEYKVCNNVIEHVSSERDLGIVIDEELSFDEHICTKVRISNALVGQIRRTFVPGWRNTEKAVYLTCATSLGIRAKRMVIISAEAYQHDRTSARTSDEVSRWYG